MTLNQAVARWWLRNAMIRHGHPPEAIDVEAARTESPTQGRTGGLGSWTPALAAALAAIGGLAGYDWWRASQQPQPAQTPIVQPEQPPTGNLYQYLQDGGFHLTPEGAP